jgi:adenylate cyclase, class 2
MLEVEIKVKLLNKEEFIKKIMNLGANYKADLSHTDIYYNLPDGLRDFAKTDEALRLRKNIEYKPGYLDNPKKLVTQSCDFTYKGPKLDQTTKTRIEHVCQIMDPDKLDSIMMALGFRKILTVLKARQLYHIEFEKTHIEIVVDKVQYLEGSYAEFEIQVSQEDKIPESKSIIFKLMQTLGYKSSDSIRISYLELVMESLKKK